MAIVAIDAGHGGQDPGATYEGRLEKDDTLRLALAVGELLQQNGVDVIFTRTEDVYDSPTRKARIANEAGADYLISFHRNAVPTPGSASGIESLVYADGGTAGEIGRTINAELAALGFLDRGIIERPNLAVLRRSNMPAVLVEVGFLDNPEDNRKFDEEFDSIVHAITDGILNGISADTDTTARQTASVQQPYYRQSVSPFADHPNASPPLPSYASQNEDMEEWKRPARPNHPQNNRLYRVQVGAFRSRSNAYVLSQELTASGYPAFLIYEDGLYKVQVGAFSRLENAIRMEAKLRASGYSTFITT